jgi:predicted membrane metal-binding protein
MALPLTLFVFGSFSAVAILSNLLVTPLVSLAMLTTFSAGVANIIWPGPGAWLALPAQGILTYMTNAIAWLANISWAKQSANLSVAGLVVIYGTVVALGVLLWRRTRHDYLGKGVVE